MNPSMTYSSLYHTLVPRLGRPGGSIPSMIVMHARALVVTLCDSTQYGTPCMHPTRPRLPEFDRGSSLETHIRMG